MNIAYEIQRLRELHRHPVVRKIAEAAEGVPCHLVGGMVRDAFLERPTKDVDVVTAGDGIHVAKRLARTLPARLVLLGGKEFPAYRLAAGDFEVDVWDREDHPLEDDLARRDFTVNALAVDLHDPEAPPVDPFGGMEDLRRRRLRATRPRVLREDPLRVLRLARFLVVLDGFSTDPETVDLAREAAPGLAEVASERIREELTRILSSPDAAAGLANMAETGLYPGLFLERPGVLRRGDASAGGRLQARLELAARYATRLLAEAENVDLELPSVDWAALHLALSLRCLDADPAEVLEVLRDKGYVHRADIRSTRTLLRLQELPRLHADRCVWLHEAGALWPTALILLGVLHEPEDWVDAAREALRLIAERGDELFDPPRLVSGTEIQERWGIEPGPAIGRLLQELRTAQLEGRIRSRDEAIRWLEDNV